MKRPLQRSLIESIHQNRIKTIMSNIPAETGNVIEFAEAVQLGPGKWQFVEDGMREVRVAKAVTVKDNGGSMLFQINF